MKRAASCGAFIRIACVASVWKRCLPKKQRPPIRNDFQIESAPCPVQWYGTQNDRKNGGGGEQGGPLIRAGKLFQIHQHFSNGEEKRSDESAPELPQRRQIVIAAVLFEDGSFEGEPDVAAGMAASWTGQAVQLSRIIPLLQTSSAVAADQDEASVLAKLKTGVGALSDEVDPAVVARLLTHFPKWSVEMERVVTVRFKAGLAFAKHNLLSDIQRLEYQRAHATETKDLRAWLEQTVTKYQRVQSPYL
jgi:hypothetical protein